MPKPKPRFTNTDFHTAFVEEWTPDNLECVRGFKCNLHEFASHFSKRVPRDVDASLSRCWVVVENGHLAGFVTLMAATFVKYGSDDATKLQLLLDEGVEYTTFPAIKIGLLAADSRAKGAGKRLVEWAIEYVATDLALRVGARFLVVDAAYDAHRTPHYDISSFYGKFGFEFATEGAKLPPVMPYRTMYLDLKPMIESMRSSIVARSGR